MLTLFLDVISRLTKARKIAIGIILLGGLSSLVACINLLGGGISGPNDNLGDSITVSEKLKLIIDENGPETMVTLPYTSRAEVVPASCQVDSISRIATSPCTCTSGTCRVGIQGAKDVYGEESFSFRFTSASGVSSNIGTAEVKIRQVTVPLLLIFSGIKKSPWQRRFHLL